MPDFKKVKISHKVKVSCRPCIDRKHDKCIPISPNKKVVCLCAWNDHEDRT